jgi:hypothetical protein
MTPIFFEGRFFYKEKIDAVRQSGREVAGIYAGEAITFKAYEFEDWAGLGFLYLQFLRGRAKKWI